MIQQKATAKNSSAHYNTYTAGTGTQWCFYGFFAYIYTGNHGFLVVVYANIIGALMGYYYAYIFQQNVTRMIEAKSEEVQEEGRAAW